MLVNQCSSYAVAFDVSCSAKFSDAGTAATQAFAARATAAPTATGDARPAAGEAAAATARLPAEGSPEDALLDYLLGREAE
jgi:hypothetical protein